MDEKPHTTSGVFVPYTDQDYAGISSAPTETVEWYHLPGQRRRFKFKWLVYVSIVTTALCLAKFTVGRYPMTINNQQTQENTSGNPPSSLFDGSYIEEILTLAEKPWDDIFPLTIPVGGVRCECARDPLYQS